MTLIMKLLEKLFPKYFSLIRQKAYHDGYYARVKQSTEQMKQIELFELQELVGKKVISISNEWDNPQIGVALRIELITQAQNPVLIIKDYLSNQEVMIMGKTYAYTPQRLQAVLKLNPFELCSLIYTYTSVFDKPKTGVRQQSDVIMSKLAQSGFFALDDTLLIEKV